MSGAIIPTRPSSIIGKGQVWSPIYPYEAKTGRKDAGGTAQVLNKNRTSAAWGKTLQQANHKELRQENNY